MDSYTVDAALCACSAAGDLDAATKLLELIAAAPAKPTSNENSSSSSRSGVQALRSTRVLHSYLRCFTEPSHEPALRAFLAGVWTHPTRAATATPAPAPAPGSLPSLLSRWNLKPDARLSDESLNAITRVAGLPQALRFALSAGLGDCGGDWSGAFRSAGGAGSAAVQNLLIRFDRFWRDYAAPDPSAHSPLTESAPKALPTGTEMRTGTEASEVRGEANRRDAARSILASAKTYASSPSSSQPRCSVTEGRALLGLLLHFPAPGPGSRTAHLCAWSAVFAAWIARGEHEAVAEGLSAMRCAPSHYSTEEQATALELAVYSALGASFPLLGAGSAAACDKVLAARRAIARASPGAGGAGGASSAAGTGTFGPSAGIAGIFDSVPRSEALPAAAANHRVTCSVPDVLELLELLATGTGTGARVAVSSALLNAMFVDAVLFRKAPAARRIVALLEGLLLFDGDSKDQDQDQDQGLPAQALAQRWTALLVGRSLSSLSARVGRSIGRIQRVSEERE